MLSNYNFHSDGHQNHHSKSKGKLDGRKKEGKEKSRHKFGQTALNSHQESA